MHQEGQPLWKKIFGNPGGQEREGKVLSYVAHRLHDGASLEEAVGEDYVRSNLSQAEVDEVISGPELLRAVRERMESTFESESLEPHASFNQSRRRPG